MCPLSGDGELNAIEISYCYWHQAYRGNRRFLVSTLEAKLMHRDLSGHVNIDIFGNQITLKFSSSIKPNFPDFRFGINLDLNAFERLSDKILKTGSHSIP